MFNSSPSSNELNYRISGQKIHEIINTIMR